MGNIKHGYGRGAKIGFPTANLDLNANYVIPKFGVYKCVAYVRGVPHVAIVNVGVHPTVGSLDKPLIEVHIPNFNEDLYGKNLKLEFIKKLRDERKFGNIEELKAQIAEIEISDDTDENYLQEKEACFKLISYLEKLEDHNYIKEND